MIYNSYENDHQHSNGVKIDRLRFGFIERLDPLKGVNLLIDASRAVDITSVAVLAALLRKVFHDQSLGSALSVQCLDKAKEFLPGQLVKDYLEECSLNGFRYGRLERSWAGIDRSGRLAIRRHTRLVH